MSASSALLLFSSLLLAQSANAPLSSAELNAKFRSIPVFIPGGESGEPVTLESNGKTYMSVFFDRLDGNVFVESVRKQPGLQKVRLYPLMLASVIDEKRHGLALVPNKIEKSAALPMWKEVKPEATEFPGVPLFFVVDSKQNYVTIVRGPETVVPLFFSFTDAAALKEESQKTSPSLGQLKVRVTTFDYIFQLLKSAPANQTRPLTLIPSKQAVADYKLLKS